MQILDAQGSDLSQTVSRVRGRDRVCGMVLIAPGLLRRWILCLRTSPLVGQGTKAPATVNTQATTMAATAATVVR